MDSIISSALEEICFNGPAGISVSSLWSKLEISPSMKSAIWRNLLLIPSIQFKAEDDAFLSPKDGLIQSVDDAEKLGVKIVANEKLRDNSVGLYDDKDNIQPQHRRALERIAITRVNGVTQSQLAKEFGIEGKNFFYVVKNLECRGLIVRQKAVVKTKEACSEGESKNSSSVTNLMYLYRYAKHLGSQQRFQINKEEQNLENLGDANESAADEDGFAGEQFKEDVIVNDYLPAMKAICDKLEEANGKVLVVSDVKRDLGYIGPKGHRAWRNIYHRLKDAGLVEDFRGMVNEKAELCIRLLKKFSEKNFESKILGWSDTLHKEQKLKFGRRSQVTDQLIELPIENQIYDMVDAEGSEGLPFMQVCERLGIDKKKSYSRLLNMSSKCGIHWQPESHKKTTAYRVWTSGNSYPDLPNAFICKSKTVLGENEIFNLEAGTSVSDGSHTFLEYNNSTCAGDFAIHSKMNDSNIDTEIPCSSTLDGKLNHMIISSLDLQELSHEPKDAVPDSDLDLVSTEIDQHLIPTETARPLLEPPDSGPCQTSCQFLTADAARREQRIRECLQEEKFILKPELYRWLVELEKDKGTKMDRKTVDRILQKLQEQGHCKCVQINVPVVTNCGRSRITQVVLNPSIQDLHAELLSEIHDKLRSFEMQIRGRGSSRWKNNDSFPVLDGVQRIQNLPSSDVQAARSEAMRANGFVLAKMVRVKLLHCFLWGYLSSSHDWNSDISIGKHVHDQKSHCGTYVLFSIDAAIRAIPLELFLQVVGSTQKFDDMIEKCKRGLRLSDLTVQEYKLLMDTQATGRLSLLIDILRRLKLIRLVTNECSDDGAKVLHANLTHALELKPHIEEPATGLATSNLISLDLRPRIRHDFILSNREAVDEYWKTLEYCYAASDPKAALHAFPGSAVHEVFLYRSWASVRVMTADQRAELLKRIMRVNLNEKLSLRECEKIAKDLNLTLEQVLRVYYDKRQRRLSRFQGLLNVNEECQSARNEHLSPRKRRRKRSSKVSSTEDTTVDTATVELAEQRVAKPVIVENFTENENICLASSGEHGIHLQAYHEDDHDENVNEPEQLEEDEESYSIIKKCALEKMKPTRTKRFSWTDEADRQLVTQYAKHRAALGAKCHRVDWTSILDLPAPPRICARRMASLKRNTKFRKALMKLCNILGERYVKHLKENQNRLINSDGSRLLRCSSKEGLTGNFSNNIEHGKDAGFWVERWDNFDDEHTKRALEDVLRFKLMAKLEASRRVGSISEEWSNMNNIEEVSATTHNESLKSPGIGGRKDSSRRSRYRRFHQKLIKFWNDGGRVGRRVYESLAVSNAVELLKLVFLSTTKAPALPNVLEGTLRRYSEHDLFAAFSYLRDRKIMIGGSGGQPFFLSAHFLHSISRSSFPINTGKRASAFSAWLHDRKKDLMEVGINLTADLQCGDIFHLFSLVSSGELSLSPCLPDEGVGEAEDLRGLKRKAEDNESQDGEHAKKLKSLTEGELVSRREKGFPGIMLSVYRTTILTANTVELFKNESTWAHEFNMNNESCNLDYSTNSECMKQMLDVGSVASIAVNSTESPWEAMAEYAEHLMLKPSDGQGSQFDLEVFKVVSAAIQRAGDQGLSIEDFSNLVDMPGEKLPELIIDVLQAFGRAFKVNAYDSIRVVDALYRSKYFLTSFGFRQELKHGSSIQSQESNNSEIQPEKQRVDISNAPLGIGKDAEDVHKITILNLPEELALPSNETPFGSMPEGSVEGKAGLPEGKEAEISKPASNELLVPILPWMNGDGTINTMVYNGLLRRVLGTVMQNPGILEDDIIRQMDVLNPQSCKRLLELMILEKHLIVRKMLESADGGPPILLQTLLGSSSRNSELVYRQHFFANPSSTYLL
ncbi:hypothetical protein SLA2020_232560 [Shorea laevis]